MVARCHWHVLCSPVCRTALQRAKPVITFQQGVIGHTLDVPVTASKYVAFGHPSASFLARVNNRFFQAAGLREPSVEYVNGGCLFDTVIELPDQFDNQTLLMVDVPGGQNDFYGIESQCSALLQLAERLLTADLPLRRLVIRPHPYWSNLDFEACQRLVREHSTRCELSHPVWSLEDDLRRSSAVVGIFSGALTVASACGLPTIFLETEHGYTTGDLACFSPRQTLLPDAAFCEIGKLLSDRRAYTEARTDALRNAREYYTNGANLKFTGEFFERLLRPQCSTSYESVFEVRFAFISTMHGSAWGGSEELWSQAATQLKQAGHDVRASVGYWPRLSNKVTALTQQGIRLETHSSEQVGTVRNLWNRLSLHDRRSSARLKRFSPDLVVISQGHNAGGFEWAKVCREAAIPYVIIIQCNCELWSLAKEINAAKESYSAALRVFCVSHKNLDLLRLQVGEPLLNAEVVRSPYNVSPERPLPWPDENGRWRLACVARLDPPAKGQDILLQVLGLREWRVPSR